jgi:hypothetical protein
MLRAVAAIAVTAAAITAGLWLGGAGMPVHAQLEGIAPLDAERPITYYIAAAMRARGFASRTGS